MKVLFAVNSESISEAIIKKYQKDYREILSYKNVYYFNAIIKEIQKDKSYDRIIISEDLEPFSNNNYESIDKFVFEKLDGISDEAHDSQGNEISIILISSDRHTKGSSFLVKIFGIGVYNALLGNDRSMEEVCRLINKPRTKKEAKMYYKIDTDDVNYRAENENEVSELEIQNILSHFRKLGRSTDRYAGSFENIASQYTDEQLKIIINCLPIAVKAVLEETSTKYQEIMSVNGGLIKGVRNSNLEIQKDQKRTGVKIDIIENKKQMTPPSSIVIPNSVKSTGTLADKRVISENSVQAERPQVKKLQTNVSKISQASVQERPQVKVPQENVQERSQVKVSQMSVQEKPQMTENRINISKEPQIKMPQTQVEISDDQMIKTVKPEPKRRGRPRKNPIETDMLVGKPKGKRGRPRKEPAMPIGEMETLEDLQDPKMISAEELPDLDTITEEQLNLNANNTMNELDDMIDFGDLMEESEEETTLEDLKEKSEQNSQNDVLEDIELPELDDLEDLDTSTALVEEDDNFLGVTEEAFDEFDDYDEYGKYETKIATQKPVEELYSEDILENEELEDIDDIDELEDIDTSDAFNLDELNDFEDIEEIEEPVNETPVIEEPIKKVENVSPMEDELDSFDMQSIDSLDDLSENIEDDDSEENNLLLDFDNNDELLSEIDNMDNDIETQENSDFNFEDNIEIPEENETINDTNFGYGNQNLENIKSPIDYSMSNLNSLMTKDKKIVTFLGSTKNGVSFLVNNLAEIFASLGIDTAILDMTKNKNSYYIYTQNEENLRKIAYSSLEKLQNGIAEGIPIKQNLTVYTALPNDGKDYSSAEPILSTLVQKHSLVLIDCDFDTDPSYFASCQEIYLVQSMDILTIQPLTAFLRDLKTQGVLEPEKVRVVINKELKVRGLTNKAIIGGMAFYNDPAMSFMTELFNKDVVTYCSIPFDENVYASYLEGMLNCRVSLSGYSKNFKNKLKVLGDMVYPLTSRKTFSNNMNQAYVPNQNGFSNTMNNTLNKMKKNY